MSIEAENWLKITIEWQKKQTKCKIKKKNKKVKI